VLNTIKPLAGLETGLATFAAVKATRGGKYPLSEAETSSLAEACGVVVPMPVWAYILDEINHMNKISLFIFFLIAKINKRIDN
jgi:hypothetical protein